MQCPKCPDSPLVATQVQTIEVDHCKTYGGIWFDNHELIPLLHERISDLAALRGKALHGESTRNTVSVRATTPDCCA